ncbi:MAG: inositol monophosphatase [Alphaproteobacteria bacterium]|nr:inositol monophosphatase [Alphaproteobacteria bacterium]
MPHVDPEKVADFIREVAASKITPRFRQLADHEVNTKTGPTDLVTIADEEAEIDLTRICKDVIPGSHVVGEEAVSKGEMDLGVLGKEEGYIWVIDPVDGTHNFATGDEKFGSILALVHKGQVIQGWILDIPGDRMAIAERGSGVELAGKRVSYPKMDEPLKDTRGFISRMFLPKQMRDDLKDILDDEFGNVETYVCCAHEYMDILNGDAFFSLYSRIRPWDHLAGAMMLEEAGGYVRKWDRSLYHPGDEWGGLISAPSEEVYDKIHELLLKKFMKSYDNVPAYKKA